MKVKEIKWMMTESIIGSNVYSAGYVGDTIVYEVYWSDKIRRFPIYFAFSTPVFSYVTTERDRVYDYNGGEWEKFEDCQKACQQHFDKVILDVYNKVKQFVEE